MNGCTSCATFSFENPFIPESSSGSWSKLKGFLDRPDIGGVADNWFVIVAPSYLWHPGGIVLYIVPGNYCTLWTRAFGPTPLQYLSVIRASQSF